MRAHVCGHREAALAVHDFAIWQEEVFSLATRRKMY